jgi:uroporphyrinogen decarboxylase
LPEFLDYGIDALNPVQVASKEMDTKHLKAEFGNRVTFWGAIDTQHVLPYGTANDVRQEVRQRICDLAPGGGYVLASVHNIQREVPPENVVAMLEAAEEFGRYP